MFETQFEYLVSFSTQKPRLRQCKDTKINLARYSQSSISCYVRRHN